MPKRLVAVAGHPYDLVIEPGALKQAGQFLQTVWAKRRVMIVSDDQVAPLYLEQVKASITAAGFHTFTYTIAAGEASKTLTTAGSIYQALAAANFNRQDGVVALGGGVVGDLAGFAASTYMRGIAFIQMPTSLLAQVDASSGGKTAVDLGQFKNLVGTFHQPDLVVIDPDSLNTLPKRYLVEGYGEIVKMAALEGGAFWQLVQTINDPQTLLAKAPALIDFSTAYKARIVVADPHENGERQFLNLGHTLGHAIELLAHGNLMHGEAVAIGMNQLGQIFEAHQLTQVGTTKAIASCLQKVGLPLTSPLLNSDEFYQQLQHDKKNRTGHLNLVYLKKIGQPALYPVKLEKARDFMTRNGQWLAEN